MGGPAEWRVLDDMSLVMFVSHNIKRLHYEGDGYDILSIGEYLGPEQIRPLTLRQVERHCNDKYLRWSYELTSADPTSQGDDPEMTFTVCIDSRA
jgi:hypothetical protein